MSIEEAAIAYVEARNRRNAAKAQRSAFECELQEEAEHDEIGCTSKGFAPCYVRGDDERCDTCIRRDVAHEAYLQASRNMGALWRKLKRLVEAR